MWYPTKKLWEIAKVYAWSSAPQEKKYFIDWNIPFVRTWDLWKYWKTKNLTIIWDYVNDLCVKEKSLVFAKKWTILFPKSWASILSNHRWILWLDAYFVSHLAWIDSWNQITNNYLYNYFLHLDLVDYCENPSYPSLKLSRIKEISIPLPQLPTQKLIVQKLDSSFEKIDKSIELTKKNLENIEELNKSVLEAVFREWKYEKVDLLTVADFNNKWILPNNKDLYNYIWLEHIESNTWRLVNFTKTEWFKIKSNKVSFLEWMVLYWKLRPYLNKVLVTEFNWVATTEILPIKCWDKLYNHFLWNYLRTDYFVNLANSNVSWARMPRVTTWFLKTIQIPLPPLEKQKEIVSHLDKVFEKNRVLKEKYENKLKDLEEMKQSLLKEAFEWRLIKE